MSNKISTQTFVKAWMIAYKEGLTQSDLSRQLDTTRANVSNRAKFLRGVGVKLPALSRAKAPRYTPQQVATLNDLIKQDLKDNEPTSPSI